MTYYIVIESVVADRFCLIYMYVYMYIILASSIQHVLKDKRVLALVQRRAAEEEGKELQGEWDDVVTYVRR